MSLRRKGPFHREICGQGLVEYGLILGLVAVICLAALNGTGKQVNGLIQKVATSLSSVS